MSLFIAIAMSSACSIVDPVVIWTRDGGRFEGENAVASPDGIELGEGSSSQSLPWHEVALIEGPVVSSMVPETVDSWIEAGEHVWRAHRRIDRLDAVASVPPLERALDAMADKDGPTAAAAHGADLRWSLLVGDPTRGMRAWAAMHRAHPSEDLSPAAPGSLDDSGVWCPRLPPVWADADQAQEALIDLSREGVALSWYAHLASLQAGLDSPRPERFDGPLGALLDAASDALSTDPSVRELGRYALDQFGTTAYPDEPDWHRDWAMLIRGSSFSIETEGGTRENAARAIAQILSVDARSGGASPLTPLALSMARDIAQNASMLDTANAIEAELASRYQNHPLAGARQALSLRSDRSNGD